MCFFFRINNDEDQYFTPPGLPFDSAMMAQVFHYIKSEKHYQIEEVIYLFFSTEGR